MEALYQSDWLWFMSELLAPSFFLGTIRLRREVEGEGSLRSDMIAPPAVVALLGCLSLEGALGDLDLEGLSRRRLVRWGRASCS